jgi:hypothetical protein
MTLTFALLGNPRRRGYLVGGLCVSLRFALKNSFGFSTML